MFNPAFDSSRRSFLLGSGAAAVTAMRPWASFGVPGVPAVNRHEQADDVEQLVMLFADGSSRTGADQLEFFHGSSELWLPSFGALFAAQRGRLASGEAALVASEWGAGKGAARTLYSAGSCGDVNHVVHPAALADNAPLCNARAVHEVFPASWTTQQIDRRAQLYARRPKVRVMLSLESDLRLLA